MNEMDMLNRLQPFMRGSKVYEEIFKAQAAQINQRQLDLEDINSQLSIDTATWALQAYESALGMVTDNTKPLSERRSKIKAKLRGTGNLNATLIKLTLSSWTGGNVDVEFTPEGIVITFIDIYGVPENLSDVAAIIEDIKPAHLPFVFVFNYLTWNEFDSHNKTWDAWDVLNLSWDELEVYKEAI